MARTFSSVPTSPAAMSESSHLQKADSTPASSPPAKSEDQDEAGSGKMDTNATVSEAMQAEERRMQEASKKENAKQDKRMRQEREKDIKSGKEGMDGKFKALEYLLSQSKVCRHSCISLIL